MINKPKITDAFSFIIITARIKSYNMLGQYLLIQFFNAYLFNTLKCLEYFLSFSYNHIKIYCRSHMTIPLPIKLNLD